MNITITPELEKFIYDNIESNRFSTVTEILLESLRLLKAREENHNTHIAKLNEEIEQGLKQLESGQCVEAEESYQELLAYINSI